MQTLQQQRNGRDLVGLFLRRLLPEHEPLTAGPSGDEMQWLAILGFIVRAP